MVQIESAVKVVLITFIYRTVHALICSSMLIWRFQRNRKITAHMNESRYDAHEDFFHLQDLLEAQFLKLQHVAVLFRILNCSIRIHHVRFLTG